MVYCLRGSGLSGKLNGNPALGMVNILGKGSQRCLPWLADWLRVPTPMRAIRVRAWVEVVGSVMEIFHFRVQWNVRNSSRTTLRECWETSSSQEANPIYEETNNSCLPARSCQEANPMYEETDDILSEGELESTWPCSIQKYCRVQRNREFVPVQWGKWGRLTMKRWGRGSPAGSTACRGTNPCVTCWKVPYIGPERGELREVNPVSAILRKSQASVALRPTEIPSLYRIWHITPAYSVVHHEFLAIGRLNPVLCLDAILQVGQPRGWTPLLLLLRFPKAIPGTNKKSD